MKKTIKHFIFLVVLLFSVTACNGKNRDIKQLESLYIELRDNSENYNQEQWEKTSLIYEDITKKLNAHTLTDEEREMVGSLKGKCAVYFSKSAINDLSKKFLDMGKELKGAINGIIEELNIE